MKHRVASVDDCALLAELNHQLILDEWHRNPMTVAELQQRMRGWLAGEYTAILFEEEEQGPAQVVAYALCREEEQSLHLRQFFVVRNRRREGIGRRAIAMLRDEVWPRGKRFTVEVLMANQSGSAFWRAVGFSDCYLGLEWLPG